MKDTLEKLSRQLRERAEFVEQAAKDKNDLKVKDYLSDVTYISKEIEKFLNDKRNVARGEEKLAETKNAINNAINRGIADRSFFKK